MLGDEMALVYLPTGGPSYEAMQLPFQNIFSLPSRLTSNLDTSLSAVFSNFVKHESSIALFCLFSTSCRLDQANLGRKDCVHDTVPSAMD